MNRKFRERLANRLAVWAERLQDWSERVRSAPLEQYGPPTRLQMFTRELADEYRKRWAEDLAYMSSPDWPPNVAGKAKVGETLRIQLPQDHKVEQ